MGEILGIGATHYPPGLVPDEYKPWPLVRMLQGDRIPAHMKDPANWPEPMRQEWGEDEGITSNKAHSAQVFNSFRKIREEIDALNPDSILIRGDDQYKTFGRTSSRPSPCWLTTSSSSSPFIGWADAQTFGTSRRIRYSRQLGIMRVAGI